MSCPHLPIELFAQVSEYLPKEDILQLSLSNKDVYDVVIGRFYRRVEIASIDDDIHDIPRQNSSMACIKALIGDVKKRNGVESLRFYGIGYTDEDPLEDIMLPAPQSSLLKRKRMQWSVNQLLLNGLIKILLSGDFEFPRLKTVIYDAYALRTEDDVEHFMAFLQRNPGLQNVVVEGYNTKVFHWWTLPCQVPNGFTCKFPLLERAIIHGPLLLLLLGFSFSPDKLSGEYGPLIRPDYMPDILPLKRIHLWWPRRNVHVGTMSNSGPSHTQLDIVDVIKAISSLCRSTLEVLVVKVDEEWIDEELIGLISSLFPNLRELEFGPSDSNSLVRFPSRTVLWRMAEVLSGLKHLTRFVYRKLSHDSGERLQYAEVLQRVDWNSIAKRITQYCPTMQFITLYSLTWTAAVLPPHQVCWG